MRQVGFTHRRRPGGRDLHAQRWRRTRSTATRQSIGLCSHARQQTEPGGGSEAHTPARSSRTPRPRRAAAAVAGVLTHDPAEGLAAAAGRDAAGRRLAGAEHGAVAAIYKRRHREVVQLALLRRGAGGAAGGHPGAVHRAAPGRARGTRRDDARASGSRPSARRRRPRPGRRSSRNERRRRRAARRTGGGRSGRRPGDGQDARRHPGGRAQRVRRVGLRPRDHPRHRRRAPPSTRRSSSTTSAPRRGCSRRRSTVRARARRDRAPRGLARGHEQHRRTVVRTFLDDVGAAGDPRAASWPWSARR